EEVVAVAADEDVVTGAASEGVVALAAVGVGAQPGQVREGVVAVGAGEVDVPVAGDGEQLAVAVGGDLDLAGHVADGHGVVADGPVDVQVAVADVDARLKHDGDGGGHGAAESRDARHHPLLKGLHPGDEPAGLPTVAHRTRRPGAQGSAHHYAQFSPHDSLLCAVQHGLVFTSGDVPDLWGARPSWSPPPQVT